MLREERRLVADFARASVVRATAAVLTSGVIAWLALAVIDRLGPGPSADIAVVVPAMVLALAQAYWLAAAVEQLSDAALAASDLRALDRPPAAMTGHATAPHNQKEDPTVPAVMLEGVGFEYPGGRGAAVADATLDIAPGAIVAIVGPNGAGKTTLLWLLAGVLAPSRGRIRVHGADPVDTLAAGSSDVAVLSAQPNPYPGSIAETIGAGSRFRPPPPADVRAAAHAVGLDPRETGTVAGLSTGQWARVGFARLLLNDAPVVVLDEPEANLDGPARDGLPAQLRAAFAGRTVVLTTHALEVARAADLVVEMADGRIVWIGGPQEFDLRQRSAWRLLPGKARLARCELRAGTRPTDRAGAGTRAPSPDRRGRRPGDEVRQRWRATICQAAVVGLHRIEPRDVERPWPRPST